MFIRLTKSTSYKYQVGMDQLFFLRVKQEGHENLNHSPVQDLMDKVTDSLPVILVDSSPR